MGLSLGSLHITSCFPLRLVSSGLTLSAFEVNLHVECKCPASLLLTLMPARSRHLPVEETAVSPLRCCVLVTAQTTRVLTAVLSMHSVCLHFSYCVRNTFTSLCGSMRNLEPGKCWFFFFFFLTMDSVFLQFHENFGIACQFPPRSQQEFC